ncbi:MAG: phosphopantothenoylcysteine decarboxylase [Planctomycetota bacterium]|nr:MAG: phosphopantothenoylcysteine decarboxylase [Planctomycetota bacterium]
MARILITSGPTRQFLDPVRYLTNASSGRMGAALAQAAIEAGHEVIVVTGPVTVVYPQAASVVSVVTTDEMLQTVLRLFPSCNGMIGAAAPCDYMPRRVHPEKIAKSGQPLALELIETPDIVATAAQSKRPDQWVVGFALETEDVRFRAIAKMEAKCCDCIVSNDASAIDAEENSVEILARDGRTLGRAAGPKIEVARVILRSLEPLIADASPPLPSPHL